MLLDFIPENQPGRDKMILILNDLVKILPKYQDQRTGAWYQVVDMPEREGNYLEMSCTPMYAYAIAKGVRKGYLPEKVCRSLKRLIRVFLDNFIVVDDKGIVFDSYLRCRRVRGGRKPYRDGSFDYYVNEIVRDNDPKGVAPLLCSVLKWRDK